MVYRTAPFFNDLERPLTWFSRSRHSLTLNISQTGTDTATVTIEGEQETAPKLSNGPSFTDLEWPVSQISRSRYYSTSNNSKMVQDGAIFYNGGPIESRKSSIEPHHFKWPWTTPHPLFQGQAILSCWISAEWLKKWQLLWKANRKPYPSFQMIPFSVTLIDL